MRRLLLPVLALTLLAPAAPADAARQSIKKSIWGPLKVDGVSQFPIYEQLGAGLYQHTVRWDRVAPTRPLDPSNPADPAYNWPREVDEMIAAGRAHDVEVSLLVLGAPPWANGGREWRWAPENPRDFAAFMEAAAKRYRGIRHWMIWGEPTKPSNFQPLVHDEGGPLRTPEQLEAPRRYARILDASYAALKRVSRRNLVIGGNTYTTGAVAPFHWLRALRLPSGRRPRMDLWGHNAFTARKPRLKAPRLSNGYADFSDLDNLANRLDRAYRRSPIKRMRRLKLFVSEMTFPTDHANYEFNFFVTRKTQARWMRAALRITRRYKRIYTFGYLGLYDDPALARGNQVERGLITREGERKPAFDAYRLG